MTEVFTHTSFGTKTYIDAIELIPTVDLLLARDGDKEAIKKIQEIEERNARRTAIGIIKSN
jgi:hypothetical protein